MAEVDLVRVLGDVVHVGVLLEDTIGLNRDGLERVRGAVGNDPVAERAERGKANDHRGEVSVGVAEGLGAQLVAMRTNSEFSIPEYAVPYAGQRVDK